MTLELEKKSTTFIEFIVDAKQKFQYQLSKSRIIFIRSMIYILSKINAIINQYGIGHILTDI